MCSEQHYRSHFCSCVCLYSFTGALPMLSGLGVGFWVCHKYLVRCSKHEIRQKLSIVTVEGHSTRLDFNERLALSMCLQLACIKGSFNTGH